MATTAYCSETDLTNRLSVTGVILRLDDNPAVITAVIARASSKVDGFCWGRYTPAALAGSDWVKETATSIALFYLATRRGNPAPGPIAADYKEAIEDLKLIKKREWDIPATLPRKPDVPVLSNVRVKLGPITPHTVVSPTRSTGLPVTDYTQPVDQQDRVSDIPTG